MQLPICVRHPDYGSPKRALPPSPSAGGTRTVLPRAMVAKAYVDCCTVNGYCVCMPMGKLCQPREQCEADEEPLCLRKKLQRNPSMSERRTKLDRFVLNECSSARILLVSLPCFNPSHTRADFLPRAWLLQHGPVLVLDPRGKRAFNSVFGRSWLM